MNTTALRQLIPSASCSRGAGELSRLATAGRLRRATRAASSSHPLSGAFYLKEETTQNNEDLDKMLRPPPPVKAARLSGPAMITGAPSNYATNAAQTLSATTTTTDNNLDLGSTPSPVVPIERRVMPEPQMTSDGHAGPVEITTTRRTTVTTTTTTRRTPVKNVPPAPTKAQTASSVVASELLNRTFYRRPLPPNLISFESDRGRRMFKEAMAAGFAENYFSLAGNFATQHDPSSCGPSALSMVLNSLSIDPGRPWKGVWRWWSDQTLSCLSPLEELDGRGITFGGFERLGECNGLSVVAKRGDRHSYEEFVEDIKTVCKSPGDVQLVISFSRKALGQTGDGHFSPVAAFWEAPDGSEPYTLVLDVARFKYPSYFVSLRDLYQATKLIDRETGLSRGWYLMRKADPLATNESSASENAGQQQQPITASHFRRTTSVCKIGERKVAEKKPASVIPRTVKDAGLDSVISRAIPDTFRSLYPAINNLSDERQRAAASVPAPTVESVIELAMSLVMDGTGDIPDPILDAFLPKTSSDLESQLIQHPLYSLVSSLVVSRDGHIAPLWTTERAMLLLLALPPACFKPFILSAFPDTYDRVEAARTPNTDALRKAVEDWRVRWEKMTQKTCDCH